MIPPQVRDRARAESLKTDMTEQWQHQLQEMITRKVLHSPTLHIKAALTAGTQLLESKAFTGGVTATHRYVQNMREGFLDGLKAQDEGILLAIQSIVNLS